MCHIPSCQKIESQTRGLLVPELQEKLRDDWWEEKQEGEAQRWTLGLSSAGGER